MRLVPLLLVLLALVTGCRGGEPAPGLLDLVAFSPNEAEVGDRLEVVGAGFPEGKPATLTFRGDLHRPGQRPIRKVEITARAMATSNDRITLPLTEELQAELCGRGDEADHTTFRGEVIAAFAPKQAGAPPVTGVLADVVLDVIGPPPSPERAAEREAEGQRALELYGMKLSGARAPFVIEELVAGGRAERAGILAGDVLLDVDGVTVREVSDVVPSGAERLARLNLRRGKLEEPVARLVDVQGFRAAPPAELAIAGGLVLFAATILLFGMVPLARVLTWVERRTVSQLAGAGSRSLMAFVVELVARDPLPSGVGWSLLRVVPPLLFLGVSAASTALALGEHLVSPDLDLGVLLAASLTAQVTTGLMLGGWRERGRWSLVAGTKRALAVLGCQLPALAGFACVVMSAGTLRIAEIVETQSAAPWGWNAFKNPVMLLAFSLVLVSAVPEASRSGARDEHAGTRSLVFFAEWGNVLIVGALVSALFLGGWRLPLASGGVSVLGAILLQVKCWAVVLVVLWARWLVPRVRVEQLSAVLLRWLLPLSALALALGAAWLSGLRSPILRALEGLSGYVLFGLAAFLAAQLAVRIAVGLRASSAQGSVNPWI